MDLLYIATHQLWPLTTGARLRDYHLARQLASHCRVTFVEMVLPNDDFDRRSPSDAGFADVVTIRRSQGYTPWTLLRGMTGPIPLTVLNYWSPRIAGELAGILRRQRFDAVQLESIHLSPYIPVIRAAPSRPALLNDYHNIESELMARYSETCANPVRRLVAGRTARLLERSERQSSILCDAITLPSERERIKFLGMAPGAKVRTIPNGVDTSFYAPAFANQCDTAAHRRSVLFVGSMDYHANEDAVQWFAREVWPRIAAENPSLEFVIVGRNPGAAIRALASPSIRVTGTVDDVRTFYADALAVVAPLRIGSGTRLKILEAMAAGAPIVSTRLGAEGIEVEHDKHLLLADSAAGMAESLRLIAGSGELRARLRDSARRLARQYDWSVLGRQLYETHLELQQRRRSVSA